MDSSLPRPSNPEERVVGTDWTKIRAYKIYAFKITTYFWWHVDAKYTRRI